MRRRAAGAAVGARLQRVDGVPKVTGRDLFGADAVPADALWIRVVRSPHARARFALGDLAPLRRRLAAVLTAADVPFNGFGIYPDIKDQPVLADGQVRYRGEAVVALVGDRAAVLAIARRGGADRLDARAAGLRDRRGDRRRTRRWCRPTSPRISCWMAGCGAAMPAEAFATCAAVAEGVFETAFVEHAYIEPEAGWAQRVGDRIEVHVTTQTPYMNRDEVANVMRLRPEAVRIVPTACGGGFGGKLDLSLHPLVALAAWKLGRPVACVYTRPESMAASTKRHPARVAARFGCDAEGKLLACDVTATFDTGAYASWGPTVANRVPVHAMGPYAIPNVRTWGEAFFTNGPPAGAFRGFGVPQAAIAHEAMMDELADRLSIDRLEFRHRNALRAGDTTATGQTLAHSAGLAQCLDALRPHWKKAHDEVAAFNAQAGTQAARRRHRLHVVRHRQHLDVQPLAHARRPVAGRHADALQRRGRYRPGLQHHHDPDRRRCAWACPRRRSRWSRATPTSPPMPARPRRRARPSSRAWRPNAPAAISASRSCAWPMPAPTPSCRSTAPSSPCATAARCAPSIWRAPAR